MELFSSTGEKLTHQPTRNPSRIDFENPQIDLIKTANELIQLLIDNPTALSANCWDLELPYRMFALRSAEPLIFINSNIVEFSEDQCYMEENDILLPGYIVKVRRPVNIKIRYFDISGVVQTKVFHNLTSRVIQHQIDVSDGIDFRDRSIKIHRDNARKKYNNFKNGKMF